MEQDQEEFLTDAARAHADVQAVFAESFDPLERFLGRLRAVVIFNTRNPHEIVSGTARPGASRVSIGSFIGRMPDRSLVPWA